MTNYSKTDLRDHAMEDLGVKDAAETGAPSDTTKVDAVAQQMIENLEDESLLIFDPSVAITVENIPGRIFLALRDMLAETIASSFSKPQRMVLGPRGQESLYENAMKRLRRSVLDGSDDTVVKACYY